MPNPDFTKDAQERAARAIAECVSLDKGENVAFRVAEQIRQAEQAAREECQAEIDRLRALLIEAARNLGVGTIDAVPSAALGCFSKALHAREQVLEEAIEVARSVILPSSYQWSEENRQKFKFGAEMAASDICALRDQK